MDAALMRCALFAGRRNRLSNIRSIGYQIELPCSSATALICRASSMTIAPIIRQHGLSECLRRSAAREPNKIALIYGDRRRSFAELDTEVDRAANWFASLEIARGDRVAILS